MIRMTRASALLAVGAALLATLTGCTFQLPMACSAIAYLYDVEVRTSGDFASLEVCAEDDCVGSAVATICLGAECGPVATVDPSLPPFQLEKTRDGEWSVSSLQSAPDRLVVRAYDDAGTLLEQEAYELEWTRTGGSEECGGPMETPPVEFAVVG